MGMGRAFGLAPLLMQVQIKFKVFGCCSAIGNFAPGDTARLSMDIARHLVEEARCAEYVQPVAEQEPIKTRRKRRG